MGRLVQYSISMNFTHWLLPLAGVSLLGWVAPVQAEESLCPAPALSRITRHTITNSDTLASIAEQYGLIPATLLGFNPSLRSGSVPVGREILVPPYNGIRVEVPAGKTWQDVAIAYNVRADVLFEINGCQASPQTIFVPGINWSPNLATPRYGEPSEPPRHPLRGYPLKAPSTILLSYGWQSQPGQEQAVFSSGIGLAANPGDAVLAMGDGVVAYAGPQAGLGNMVVINHAQGLQTRYAQLDSPNLSVGQSVRQGDEIGRIRAESSDRAYLYFEIRSNSGLGWVAEDPQRYIPTLRIR